MKEKAVQTVRDLGRLTPMAIVSAVLPMAGSVVLVAVGYPLGLWLRGDPVVGSVVFLFGVLVFCGFALVPTNLIGILGGWSFDFWLGILALMFGIVGAATVSFFINRKISGDKLPDLTGRDKRAEAIRKALITEGFWKTTAIITLIRMSVAMPFAFTNFFLAAVKVPVGSYAIGTLLGMLPRSSAMVYVGSKLTELDLEGAGGPWTLAGGIAATVLTIIVIAIVSRHALDRLTMEQEPAAC